MHADDEQDPRPAPDDSVEDARDGDVEAPASDQQATSPSGAGDGYDPAREELGDEGKPPEDISPAQVA